MAKKIALLVGGWSAERQVSLDKGKHVEAALREAGYEVDVIDVEKDIPALIRRLTPAPDVVFNNLYGRGGEDGQIQAILEILEIPYTHSGVAASAIGMDKVLTKKMAASVGVRVSDGRVATKEEVLSDQEVMARPYVVKPVNEGSSVGVRIVMEGENQKPLDAESWVFGDEVLVEKYIPGREIHVAVLDGKAQGVTEIKFPGRFFDYDAKYRDQRTQLVTPAPVPEIVAQTAMEFAERMFGALGCEGIARCDFRFDDSKPGADGVYFLEINTMPGLSPGSIAVIQPEHNGMRYVELCSYLVETAQCQQKPKTEKSRKTSAQQAAKQYA
jgi:D-alanine-D-alanine ligase